jgi:hypothetical protein
MAFHAWGVQSFRKGAVLLADLRAKDAARKFSGLQERC